MNFEDLAKERYSVRKFSSRKVEQEKLDRVLQAGRLSPSACNYQPHRILVIENEEAHAKIKKCTPCHFDAPIVLLICYDNTVSAKRKADGKELGDIDASIVTTQMMLQAADIGLGTTWVERFDPSAVTTQFALPENLVPSSLLPLGYPADDAAPNKDLHFSRKPIEETVFYNSFS
jgi:Nitroreductase